MKIGYQEINKAYIVESLRAGDRSTGHEISEHIKSKDKSISTNFITVQNKTEFFNYLVNINTDADEEDGILLFIEVHGGVTGFDIGDEEVLWEELNKYLISINESSRMGLVIIFSCCYGIFYFRQTTLSGRSPYYVMLGVDTLINENRLLNMNMKLVDGFFENKLLNEIVQKSNIPLNIHDINLTFLDAGNLFVNAFDFYLSEECKPENLDKRADDCFKLLNNVNPDHEIEFDGFKKLYLTQILNRDRNEDKYNQIRDRFLMTDLEGSLYERFHVDFDEVYKETGLEDILQEMYIKYA